MLEDYRKQLVEMTLENKRLLELQAINKDMADDRRKFDKILKDLGIKEEKKNIGDISREDMDAYRDSIITLFDCEKKRVSKINKNGTSARRKGMKILKSKFQPILISRSFLMNGMIKSLGMTK